MRDVSEMMSKHILVPIKFRGSLVKAPFLLFVGWTIEERRWYEEALIKLREYREEQTDKTYTLCLSAARAADSKRMAKQEAIAIQTFFEEAIGEGTSLALFCEIELSWEKHTEFRDLWLTTQIHMVSVPKYEF